MRDPHRLCGARCTYPEFQRRRQFDVHLTSVAGRLPPSRDIPEHRRSLISIHGTRFSELIGDEFMTAAEQGRWALGIQVTAYTQTAISRPVSAIAPRPGRSADRIRASCWRVKVEETVCPHSPNFPRCGLIPNSPSTSTTDNNDPSSPTSCRKMRIGSPMLRAMFDAGGPRTATKGQAFALLDGGQLYKLRPPIGRGRCVVAQATARDLGHTRNPTRYFVMSDHQYHRRAGRCPVVLHLVPGGAGHRRTLYVVALAGWPTRSRGIAHDHPARSALVANPRRRRFATNHTVYEWLYRAVFAWTGLDELMRRAHAPEHMARTALCAFVTSNWGFRQPRCMDYPFAMRLGVLILAMPLFFTVAIGATADGVVTYLVDPAPAANPASSITVQNGYGCFSSQFGSAHSDSHLVLVGCVHCFGLLVRTTVAWFKSNV